MTKHRTLCSALIEGEVVHYKYKGQVFQAEYQSGILVNADDTSLTYTTPGGFANSCSGGSVNGWQACRIERDGVWTKLGDLPWIDLEDEPVKVSKKMPPQTQRKKPATIQKAAIMQPIEPQSIIAGIIVRPEPLIVKSVKRITLIQAGDNWLDEESGETYLKDSNGDLLSS
jgi:hypothetical protein